MPDLGSCLQRAKEVGKNKPKPESLYQNCYLKYDKYFQTFCGLQPEELSALQTNHKQLQPSAEG